MPIEELICQLEVDPQAVLSLPEVRMPGVFDAWIRRCLELTSANPREGLPHVDTAVKVANTKCEVAQCYGVKAAAHRNLGEFNEAQSSLDLAFHLGECCAACEADLLRRRGWLHASLGMELEALRDVNAAIEAYRGLNQAEHDLEGHGLASSLLARGAVIQYFGQAERALLDFSQALTEVDPKVHKSLYGHALLNMGAVLANTSRTLENLKLANEHIREAWKYFSGRKHEASREKAHLTWQTAMIRFELRKHPEGLKEVSESPAKLRGKMETAMADFIEVRMPAEATGVAADLAIMLFPKRVAVLELMDDIFSLIRARWSSFTPEARKAFEPVRKAMDAVCRAADQDVTVMKSTELENRIRATIQRLRETAADAAQGELLPCLLTWPTQRD